MARRMAASRDWRGVGLERTVDLGYGDEEVATPQVLGGVVEDVEVKYDVELQIWSSGTRRGF